MEGAEAHAVLAQVGARGLVERLDVVGDLGALEHAERLDDLEGDAAGEPGDVVGGAEHEQRRQQALDMRARPQVEPRLHRFVARRR